jgi:hypothetical protein
MSQTCLVITRTQSATLTIANRLLVSSSATRDSVGCQRQAFASNKEWLPLTAPLDLQSKHMMLSKKTLPDHCMESDSTRSESRSNSCSVQMKASGYTAGANEDIPSMSGIREKLAVTMLRQREQKELNTPLPLEFGANFGTDYARGRAIFSNRPYRTKGIHRYHGQGVKTSKTGSIKRRDIRAWWKANE